jgi:hypothetical protein
VPSAVGSSTAATETTTNAAQGQPASHATQNNMNLGLGVHGAIAEEDEEAEDGSFRLRVLFPAC